MARVLIDGMKLASMSPSWHESGRLRAGVGIEEM